MKTIELFSGTQSFSKVARELGHETFAVEIDKTFESDLCADILEIQREDLPKDIDVLWASPPCTTFSVASLRYYWKNGKPKNAKTWNGISMIMKTIDLIKEIQKDNPDLIWFIENPRGMLRKQDIMQSFKRNTISYCQYGLDIMKPTDIWNNCDNWIPRPMCKPGASCHQRAGRGAKNGVQGIYNLEWEKKRGGSARARAVIPSELFHEIFNSININSAKKSEGVL